jgi:hypothetical protein
VNRLYDESVHVVLNIYCTYVFGAGRHGMRSMENLGAYNPSNEESPTKDGMPSPEARSSTTTVLYGWANKSQVRRRNRIMCLMSQVRLLTRAPTTKTAATTMSARVVRNGKGLLVFVTSYPWYLCLCVFCRLIVFAVSQAEGVKCWAGRGGRDKYRRKAQAGVIYQKRG